MSFWSTDFMNDRRKQWLNALVKFQYLVNGTWYDATINTKRVTGNKVEITGCHKSCLCNKNSKTGDTAEGKVIRELEKVGTNRHDQCADCQ